LRSLDIPTHRMGSGLRACMSTYV